VTPISDVQDPLQLGRSAPNFSINCF
jgi:hypothetical protein